MNSATKHECFNGARLATTLDDDAQLIPRPIDDVPLDIGEVAYADLHAGGWRYQAVDVAYERMAFVAGGGLLMTVTALTTAIGNRRRHRAALQMAAPQWRALGPLRIVVTSQRLLVRHRGRWWPVWYGDITDARCDAVNGAIDLFFESDPPYRLAGPDMATVAVVLTRLAARVGASA